MINFISGLKQHTLEVNGHALFHCHMLRRALRSGKQAKIIKGKYVSAGKRTCDTVLSQSVLYTTWPPEKLIKTLSEIQYATKQCLNLIMVRHVLEQTVGLDMNFLYKCRCYSLLCTKFAWAYKTIIHLINVLSCDFHMKIL